PRPSPPRGGEGVQVPNTFSGTDMDSGGSFLAIMLSIGKALSAVTLPVIIGNTGSLLLHHIAPADFYAIPIFKTIARAVGIMVGILVLHASILPSHYALEDLFLPSSPWNLSFGQFLLQHANPMAFRLIPIESGDAGTPTWRLLLLVAAVVLMVVNTVLAVLVWPNRFAWRALGVCVGTVVLTGWTVVYLVSLALWSLHVLNFWVFALLGIYYHYRTSHH
ncbi:MAG: hypothetical protein H7840_03540, partial [Alphaproteobacteria bacterium]